MTAPLTNISFDGSPVLLRLESPFVVAMDPIALQATRDEFSSLPIDAQSDPGALLERLNVRYPSMSCYRVPEFEPGLFVLDPHDIQRFGDEDDDFDYDQDMQEERPPFEDSARFPFVAVDSGTLIFVDFAHLSQVLELLAGDQYDRILRFEAEFEELTALLGGPYFALILAAGSPQMHFDGDGVYSVTPNAIKPTKL